MANKKSKFWIILTIIPVILILGFIVFLKLYFTSDRLKSLILPELETALNRNIQVEDVSLSIFPTFGIDVDQLVISNPVGEQYQKENFLKAERILFKVKLLPLFKNQIFIKEILIQKPELYLEINKKGKSNFTFGEPAKDTAKVEVKTDITKPASLIMNNFQIKDGKIEYLDLLEGTHCIIEGYYQKSDVKSLNSNVLKIINEVEISNLNYGDTVKYFIKKLPLKTYHTLTYSIEKDELLIDSCYIQVKDLKANGGGRITSVSNIMNFDLNFTSEGKDLNSILSLIPEEYTKQMSEIKSSGDYKLNLFIIGDLTDTTMPAITGKILLSNGIVKYIKLPKSITDINVMGEFEKSSSKSFVNLKKFSLKLGTTSVYGDIVVNNFDNPYIKTNLQSSINLNEIKEYYPLEADQQLSGVVDGDIKFEGEIQKPDKLKARGKVTFKNVSVASKNINVQNISGEINFDNDRIFSKSIKLLLGKSDLNASFELKNFMSFLDEKLKAKPSLNLDLNSNILRTEDLFIEKKSEEVKTKQEETQAFILPDVDALVKMKVDKFEMERFEFSNLIGQLNVSDMIINLKNLSFNIFDGKVQTDGKIDMKDLKDKKFSLNLNIQGVQANSFLSKFTTFGNNLFGKLNLNTTIKGSVDDTLGLIPPSLEGNGNIKIFEGRLVGYPVMQKISEFTGVNELKEVFFKEWANAFSILDGKILLKDLNINALNSELSVNGYQSFDGNVQMNVDLKLSKELSSKVNIGGTVGQVVNLFKEKDGRITLPLVVTGKYYKPTISLNISQQKKHLETQIQQEIEKRKEEIKEKVTEEVEKMLDTVKQKGAEELKKKTEDALKKLLRKP